MMTPYHNGHEVTPGYYNPNPPLPFDIEPEKLSQVPDVTDIIGQVMDEDPGTDILGQVGIGAAPQAGTVAKVVVNEVALLLTGQDAAVLRDYLVADGFGVCAEVGVGTVNQRLDRLSRVIQGALNAFPDSTMIREN